MNKIPEIIQYLLKKNQITANALAVALKIPTPTIHRIATGDVQDPRVSTLSAIADYFDVTLDELMGKKQLHKNKSNHPMLPLYTLKDIAQDNKIAKYFFELPYEEKNIFSIILQNDFYEPHFCKNEYLVVDPTVNPETGDYVLVSFIKENNTAILKYSKEGKNEVFYSLKNKSSETIYVKDEQKIIGVIKSAIKKLKF